jgi:hypothetical protein
MVKHLSMYIYLARLYRNEKARGATCAVKSMSFEWELAKNRELHIVDLNPGYKQMQSNTAKSLHTVSNDL